MSLVAAITFCFYFYFIIHFLFLFFFAVLFVCSFWHGPSCPVLSANVDIARITSADAANFVENFYWEIRTLCFGLGIVELWSCGVRALRFAVQDINCLKLFNRKWLINFHMIQIIIRKRF